MRDFDLIVSISNELDPWDIHVVIKFMQLFEKQGIILQSEIKHSKAPFALGFLYHRPGC
jgi:hypothetical protein